MAQRVTLAIPNPTNGAVDVNVSAANPLPIVSSTGTSTSPDIIGFGPAAAPADGVSNVNYSVGIYDNTGTARVALRTANTVFDGTQWFRMRGDATGTYTVAKGTSTIANAQGSVTTTTGQMVPARVGRSSVTIINESTTVIRYGAAGVTAANGAYLAGVAGTAVTIPTAAAVHGIVGTGTAAFSYIENF